jgi:hypothetical protein
MSSEGDKKPIEEEDAIVHTADGVRWREAELSKGGEDSDDETVYEG